jgi:hypothetical protein
VPPPHSRDEFERGTQEGRKESSHVEIVGIPAFLHSSLFRTSTLTRNRTRNCSFEASDDVRFTTRAKSSQGGTCTLTPGGHQILSLACLLFHHLAESKEPTRFRSLSWMHSRSHTPSVSQVMPVCRLALLVGPEGFEPSPRWLRARHAAANTWIPSFACKDCITGPEVRKKIAMFRRRSQNRPW